MSLLLAAGGAGSPVNYTLACDAGAYTYTGQAATLTVGRRLALDAGAYTYTGQVATLTVGRRLALDAGAYTYTGQTATLTVGRRLALDAGAYTYSGVDATLDYVSGAAPPAPPTVAFRPDVEVYTGRNVHLVKRKRMINKLLLLG